MDGTDEIIDRDPREVLSTAADDTAEAEPERRQ